MNDKLEKLEEIGYKIYSKTTNEFPVIGGKEFIDVEGFDQLIDSVEVIVNFDNIKKLVYMIWHSPNGSGSALAVFDGSKEKWGKNSYVLNHSADSISEAESAELKNLKIEDLKISSIKQKLYF